jgi:acetylornithine deacetylase
MNNSLLRSVSSPVKDAQRLLRPLRRDLVHLLQELIRVNTVAIPPNGNETSAQLVLRDFLRRNGIRPELYEVKFSGRPRSPWEHKDRKYKGRKNLVARLSGSGSGRSLLLNGHMDTVPAGKVPWSASPWSGKLQKGNIFGLGSFDMKGGLVAQAGVLCAIKAAGIRLGGDLIFESVIDEEWCGGGGTLAARQRGDSADACIVSEGTQLDIFRATRGGWIVDLLVQAGNPSAYFSQSEVLSPTVSLGRLLAWVDSWRKRRKKVSKEGAYAKFPDPAPVQILAVEANSLDPNIPLSVPLSAAVRVYFQFLPNEDVGEVIQQIRLSLKAFAATDPFFRLHPIQVKPLTDKPLLGHELPVEHAWTQCMIASASAALGKAPTVTAASYPCDAFLIHREFGIPTLLFGPRGGGAHNPNEYVEVESVIQTAEVVLTAALQWCSER